MQTMTKFEKELLDKLDHLNKNLEDISRTLQLERPDWEKILKIKDEDESEHEKLSPGVTPTYPQYEKIPYWLQPGFKWPEVTCNAK